MTWSAFLNNQSVKLAMLLPNGQHGYATRYIFIEGRNVPIILTDEKSTVSQSWAVGINDGKNPRYQLGYEGAGNIQITLKETNDTLQYTASSGFTTVTKDL